MVKGMKKIGIAAILMTLSIVAGCNFIHNRGTIEAYSQSPVEVSEENSVSDTDGTINLNKEPLKEITIKRNQTVVLKSQTMDGGVTLEIKYE